METIRSRLLAASALSILVILTFLSSAEAQPVPASGKVTDITLYQGQALVTRVIPLEVGAGAREIVVGDLPEHIVPESLYAEGGNGVEVRAVRFRTRAVGEEPRDDVRKLDEALKAAGGKQELNRKTQEGLTKRAEYLDKLEGFVAPTAKLELSRGLLNAESLQKVTLFAFEQRATIAAESVKLAGEAKEIEEEISLLQRQRAELTSRSSKTLREAILFAEKGEPAGSVRLNYLVSNCGWSPSYVLRAAGGAAEIQVEYNALVHQMTGEDWTSVTLILSTASPALSAAGPGLAPFYVTLVPDAQPQAQQVAQGDVTSQVRSIKQRQAKAIVENRSALNLDQNLVSSWSANSAANDFQCMELLGGKEVLTTLRLEEPDAQDGPSLSYRLGVPVSLASRSDQQMVRILASGVKARFYHVATPVLSSYVYREAELTNSTQEDLLAGPVMAYLDGRFVGRAEIPTVTRGQTFVVGLGADPQLRTRREMLSKTEAVQGGNREYAIRIALAVESYRDAPATVRLLDRLPYSSQTGEIRVTLKDQGPPLSEDKLYVRRERPKGLLRWDIEVPAHAVGEGAKAVEYSYTMEVDRKFRLSTPTSAQGGQAPAAMQQEFQELEKARRTGK
jgi:uncharacterized protein (TIGR02231 family)